MNNEILIWAEVSRNNYINPVVFELANKALELAQNHGDMKISALLLIKPNLIGQLKEVFKLNGFDKVYYIEDELFSIYKSDIFAKFAVEIIKKIEPKIILIGATHQGRDFAPRISSSLHTGLTADCTALCINDEKNLEATRPTFGGQLMATILSKTYPQMATVRPGIFKPLSQKVVKETEFIQPCIDIKFFQSKMEILDFKEKIQNELNNINSANIIVAGGRGMQNKEGFELLSKLAEKLGGVVGASRIAVEMGLASPEFQIGQTGKTVSPKLYIACGISGAVQHTIGMENSDKIIAINIDKNAPIFKIADYGMIGDAFKVIPELLKIL